MDDREFQRYARDYLNERGLLFRHEVERMQVHERPALFVQEQNADRREGRPRLFT